MKRSVLTQLVGLLLAGVFLASGGNAAARPPRSREQCGVLRRIDRETQTLSLLPSQGRKSLEVLWKKDTTFLRNWKSDSVASVKEGMRICVFYRSPFFGKPFATKVVWEQSTAGK